MDMTRSGAAGSGASAARAPARSGMPGVLSSLSVSLMGRASVYHWGMSEATARARPEPWR